MCFGPRRRLRHWRWPAVVQAAELKIVDVKAYAFLEHAGKLSDDLISSDQSLVDAPRGGALGGDTATGVLLDFTFEGDKNASPKYATAIVDLTQTGHSGQPVVTHKAFTNFIFGLRRHGAQGCVPGRGDVHAARHPGPCRQDPKDGEARSFMHGSARREVTARGRLSRRRGPARPPSNRARACAHSPIAPRAARRAQTPPDPRRGG